MQQLPSLVSAMGSHLLPWLPQLIELVTLHWDGPLQLQARPHPPAERSHRATPRDPLRHPRRPQVLLLLAEITGSMRSSLGVYVPKLVPRLIAVVESDAADRRVASLAALGALEGFGPLLDEYSSLLLPALLRLACAPSAESRATLEALHSLHRLSTWLPLSRIAPALVERLLELLRANAPSHADDVRAAVRALLVVLACQLGPSWIVFDARVAAAIGTLRLDWPEIATLGAAAREADGQPLLASTLRDEAGRFGRPRAPPPPRAQRLSVKHGALARLWEPQQRTTPDDWNEWMRRLSVELLRESPSPSLRACAPVAQMHAPLARRLFQVGFLACWSELIPSSRDALISCLELAFTSPATPSELLQAPREY